MNSQADAIVEHLTECTEADAVLVVDGNADDIVTRMVAEGWTLRERIDLVVGKRIRFLEPPPECEEAL